MTNSNHHRSLARSRPRARPSARTTPMAARDRRPRRGRARPGRRRATSPHTRSQAIAGDVSDEWHRGALLDAAGGVIDLLVNNASTLGPSPQPDARGLPARGARARLPRQRRGAAGAHPAGAAADPGRRPGHQRHLRCRARAVRGMGRLRILEGCAGSADRDPRRRAARPADLRRRPRRHAHPDASGSVPRRGHLRPAAARGQRPRPARADRRRPAERPLPRGGADRRGGGE